MFIVNRLILFVALSIVSLPVLAQEGGIAPIKLENPIDCEVGWNCWIVNYVDHDRSSAASDYRCGTQTYDAHKGTDFMIRTERDMSAGVIVRAAADGEVVGVRDGMKDVNFRKRPPEAVEGKYCGNGVRIDHGEGWFTQYCHMRKNSIRLKKGDQIKAGDKIGYVGNSGKSEVPHLHFQVQLERILDGELKRHTVDPFVGIGRNDLCQASRQALWSDHLLESFEYKPIGLIDVGFAARQPNLDGLVKGVYEDEVLSIRSPQLFLWMRALWVKKGDKVTFRITGPEEEEILNYTSEIEKDRAHQLLFSGLRRPTLNWDEGQYKGYIVLTRQDEEGGRVYRNEAMVTLR